MDPLTLAVQTLSQNSLPHLRLIASSMGVSVPKTMGKRKLVRILSSRLTFKQPKAANAHSSALEKRRQERLDEIKSQAKQRILEQLEEAAKKRVVRITANKREWEERLKMLREQRIAAKPKPKHKAKASPKAHHKHRSSASA